MKLTPQQQAIVNYLEDREWHCMANPGFYMKDDRKRISELNQLGYVIESKPCDGRCNVQHNSRILMRRLVKTPHEVQNALFAPIERKREVRQIFG